MKTFLLSLILSLGAMFSGLALATQPGNNGGGNGGCGVGQQTNGCGGQGGAGGAGGAGGNGTGVGVGIANAAANAAAASSSTATGGNAAVVGSGNSSVRNTNNNANVQGQSQSSRNNNQSSATGGTASATGGASGGNTFTVEGDKGDVIYAPAQERNPVATAYAAPLTASNGTCMGSSSGGAQSAAFGFSVGTTWTDGSCDIRYDAEALRAAGLPMAARARLCQKPEIAKAMEAAGTPCPKARTAAVEGNGLGQPTAQRQPMPWQAGG